jgi:hypothetical protein
VSDYEQKAAGVLADVLAAMRETGRAEGRAEVAAKVRELAELFDALGTKGLLNGHKRDAYVHAAERLRALADEANREARPEVGT